MGRLIEWRARPACRAGRLLLARPLLRILGRPQARYARLRRAVARAPESI